MWLLQGEPRGPPRRAAACALPSPDRSLPSQLSHALPQVGFRLGCCAWGRAGGRMGLPCELPPALHPGRGWGLCGLFHAKSLLDPPPPWLLPGAGGAAPFLSLGEGAAGGTRGWDPASGGDQRPWTRGHQRCPCPGRICSDSLPPQGPSPQGEFISCDSLNLSGDRLFFASWYLAPLLAFFFLLI